MSSMARKDYCLGFTNKVFCWISYIIKAKEGVRRIGSMRLAALIMTKATTWAVQDIDR